MIEILSSLSTEARRDFEKSCRWRRFQAPEQIIDQENEDRDVYFLASGKVRVLNFTLQGREVTLEELVAGTYFGELAALDGRPRSASVMALEPSDVAKMAPARFLKLLEMHPTVALKVMVNLAAVIRASTERIIDLSTLSANDRVHGELLRRAATGMRENGQVVVTPIPVHSDMASRAGTTRETVARVLNELARKGIVRREKDALVIRDEAALREMVEEVRG